jgi:Ca2+-binding RTX toxin-like protein
MSFGGGTMYEGEMVELRRWRQGVRVGLVAAALAGCGAPAGLELDSRGFPGIASQSFALLAAACAIDGQGNLTLTVADGESAYLSLRTSDGKVVANAALDGQPCTAEAARTITVNGDAGDNKVIVDFVNGVFGGGTDAGPHLVVALGAERLGDSVKIRGTMEGDHYTFGEAGGSVNGDALLDVSLAGVEDLVVSAGPGNDVVTGAGGQGTGAPFPASAGFTVYGGDGDDALSGGGGPASLYGGDGDDTLDAALGTLDCGPGDADTALQRPAVVIGCER